MKARFRCVRFIVDHTLAGNLHSVGTVAMIAESIADGLVRRKIAEYVEDEA